MVVSFFFANVKIKLVSGTKFGVGCAYFLFLLIFDLVSGTNLHIFIKFPILYSVLISAGKDFKSAQTAD